MDGVKLKAAGWQLEGPRGAFTSGRLSGSVNSVHPEQGLHDLHFDGRELPGGLMSIARNVANDWPSTLLETYIRDNDLVASYTAADDWPYSPQVYWTAGTLDSIEGVFGSLSLLVSVQTHLLDTRPVITATTLVDISDAPQLISVAGNNPQITPLAAAHAAVEGQTACLLYRLAEPTLSYIEIVPASDYQNVVVSNATTGARGAVWTLFAEFMEKGVIRRARVMGAFVHRARDLEVAAECCRTIERSPLPLTV
jgi:hypothetical protein